MCVLFRKTNCRCSLKLTVINDKPLVKLNIGCVCVHLPTENASVYTHTHLTAASLHVCRLILAGNRQSASQPEYDLESENTRQETKCVTLTQSFFHSPKDTERAQY